jgi:hypothetical protein
MAVRLSRDQRRAVAIVCGALFSAVAVLALLLAYYAFRNARGDASDPILLVLDNLLAKRGKILEITQRVLSALPALAIAVCVERRGVLSPFGKFAMVTLLIALVLSAGAAILTDPNQDSPVREATADSVVQASTQMASFALTYILMLLGLWAFTGNGPEVSR